jgi:hypothetical protein
MLVKMPSEWKSRNNCIVGFNFLKPETLLPHKRVNSNKLMKRQREIAWEHIMTMYSTLFNAEMTDAGGVGKFTKGIDGGARAIG